MLRANTNQPWQPGVQVADFLQVGRRSRLRDLTKHLATDAEIRLLQNRFCFIRHVKSK